jgi:hypothetical protein
MPGEVFQMFSFAILKLIKVAKIFINHIFFLKMPPSLSRCPLSKLDGPSNAPGASGEKIGYITA